MKLTARVESLDVSKARSFLFQLVQLKIIPISTYYDFDEVDWIVSFAKKTVVTSWRVNG